MAARQALIDKDIMPRRFLSSLNISPYLAKKSRQSCPISESTATRVHCLPLNILAEIRGRNNRQNHFTHIGYLESDFMKCRLIFIPLYLELLISNSDFYMKNYIMNWKYL